MSYRFVLRPGLCIKDIEPRQFRVFISYKTEDYIYAEKIALGLRKLGFSILFLTPDEMAPRVADDELKKRLTLQVFHVDAICLIVTHKSLKSTWVQYEFVQAVERIGRVVFVSDEFKEISADEFFHSVDRSYWSKAVSFKHTTLQIDGTDSSIESLAVNLINDPEVGWIDGRESIEPFYPPRGRAYKLASIRRRLARTHIMEGDDYKGRRICDVIPFVWDEIRCEPGNIEGAIKWMIFRCGRRNLAEALLHDKLEIFHENMSLALWHQAIFEIEMNSHGNIDNILNFDFSSEIANSIAQLVSDKNRLSFNKSLDMLVVSDLRLPSNELDEMPSEIERVSWSYAPPDLELLNELAAMLYPNQNIKAIVGRIRRNRPADEGLDLGEYGLKILENDRPDLCLSVKNNEFNYCVDTILMPIDNSNRGCVVVGTILGAKF